MKKLYLLILLIIPVIVFSQSRLDQPEIYLGTSHGVSASMIHFSPSVEQEILLGYNGGIVFRYIDEKNVGIQAELNFFQRGWKEKGNIYAKQLNYIELPFLTHIYFGNSSRFFINLGPKISYLLSENVLKNLSTNSTETQHITKVQHPFDYGICGGFGVLFRVKKNIFQFDTRFNYSLSDIFSNSKKDYFETSNNINLSINLGWLLQIK
ncbi:MAG TPA: porin family protein [Paludibacteraceae bacterium]|nr:porin family protein [Paludibacteraceae bacterium]